MSLQVVTGVEDMVKPEAEPPVAMRMAPFGVVASVRRAGDPFNDPGSVAEGRASLRGHGLRF